jgi:hypothetical protein
VGNELQYTVQPNPDGLAQVFILGNKFIAGSHSALILGDNIFYGHDLVACFRKAAGRSEGATVFAYHVRDPERYGVVAFAADGRATSLEEKPTKAKSNYPVTGYISTIPTLSIWLIVLSPLPAASLRSRTSIGRISIAATCQLRYSGADSLGSIPGHTTRFYMLRCSSKRLSIARV